MGEIAVGVGGGDVGGVSNFTSSSDFAGWVPWQVAVAARSNYRLFCSWCLPDFDLSGFSGFRGSWGSLMAQTGSLEGVYSSMAPLAWSVAYEDKLGVTPKPVFNKILP
jgi:hypothetical protein